MTRFAEHTTVAVGKSRGEIDSLLRAWGCDQLSWADDFLRGRVCLRFTWTHDKATYIARFNLQLPTDEELQKQAVGLRYPFKVAPGKLDKLREGRGRTEHRILLLWLKAALNAVEAGIVEAAAVFLPFIEDAEGNTVAEIALPRLAMLREGGAGRLLTDGGR